MPAPLTTTLSNNIEVLEVLWSFVGGLGRTLLVTTAWLDGNGCGLTGPCGAENPDLLLFLGSPDRFDLLKCARIDLKHKLDADFYAHIDTVVGDMTELHPADRAAQIADAIDHRTHRKTRPTEAMRPTIDGTSASTPEENVDLAAIHFEATMTYPDYGPIESFEHLPAQPAAPTTPDSTETWATSSSTFTVLRNAFHAFVRALNFKTILIEL